MTTEVENQPQAEAAEASLSFLDRAIEATTQTPCLLYTSDAADDP